MLEAKGNLVLLCERKDFLPAGNAIFLSLFVLNSIGFHTRKGDHALIACGGAKFDGFKQFPDAFLMIGRIHRTRFESMTCHQRNVQSEIPDHRIMLWRNAFHRDKAHLLAQLGQLGCGHGVEGPPHDGLLDPSIPDPECGVGLIHGRLGPGGVGSGQ